MINELLLMYGFCYCIIVTLRPSIPGDLLSLVPFSHEVSNVVLHISL